MSEAPEDPSNAAEHVAFRAATVPGVHSMAVRNSNRCWVERHERYAFTSIPTAMRATGTWHYRGWRSRHTRPGMLMLMEPDTLHVTASIKGGSADFDVLFVEANLVERWLSGTGHGGSLHLATPDCTDDDIGALFRELHTDLAAPGVEEREMLERLCVATSTLFERAGENGSNSPAVRDQATLAAACRLIAEDYTQDPTRTLDTHNLASRVGYSYFWFIRAFKRVFGVTPYQYFLRVRLARARSEILRGPSAQARNLTDVAALAGYADLPHMTREFKRFVGVGPLAFMLQTGNGTQWKRGVASGPTRPE